MKRKKLFGQPNIYRHYFMKPPKRSFIFNANSIQVPLNDNLTESQAICELNQSFDTLDKHNNKTKH